MRHFEESTGITEATAVCNGTSLHYAFIGKGKPIIFIHGTGLDSRMWFDQLQHFGGKYQAIAYDMRGFGLSSPLSGVPYSTSGDLASLMDVLGLDSAHIAGVSRGGRVAINFAIDHPNRVRRLILSGANINGMPLSREFLELKQEVQFAAKNNGVDHAKRLWINSCLFASSLAHSDIHERLRMMLNDYTPWHWLNADTEVRTKPEAIERLEEIKAPTLVLLGERDIPHFHKSAEILSSTIPNAHLITLPQAGHMSPMENPAAFNKAIEAFLEDR